MAMTAWSANVLSSSIWLSVNRQGTVRATKIAPMTCPSRTIGTPRQPRQPAARAVSLCSYWGSARTSGTWTTAEVRTARAITDSVVRGIGNARRTTSRRSAATPCSEVKWSISPSTLETRPISASHRLLARSPMMSNTGCTSVGELLMTRRISAVAVCCPSASVRSRLRASSSCEEADVLDGDDRLVAKVVSELDLLLREGFDPGLPQEEDRPSSCAFAQHRDREAPSGSRRASGCRLARIRESAVTSGDVDGPALESGPARHGPSSWRAAVSLAAKSLVLADAP